MKQYFQYLIAIFLCLVFACKGGTEELPPNPFAPYENPDTTPTTHIPQLDPKSFAGMHQYIFKPNCANSGCHDGTFEPDFRTIESTYNTLVLQKAIQTYAGNNMRVIPGNPDASLLYLRLTQVIGSGTMPVVIDPTSDWNSKKTDYIQNVRDWIQNGAKDMFGNAPQNGNLQPSMQGVMAFANGSSTALEREPNSGILIVPPGTSSIDIWFSLTDDNAQANELQGNTIKFSTDRNDFSAANTQNMQVLSPIMGTGYFGAQVPFTHKVSLNLSAYSAGTTVFFRIYVKDPQQPNTTEIPATGSATYIQQYFACKK